MRLCRRACLAIMLIFSDCAGATGHPVALSQAHELYFGQYNDSRAGIFSDSGLLFIKVRVDRDKRASRKQIEFKALSEARSLLFQYLVEEKGMPAGSFSLSKIPSRVLENRRDGNQHLYVLVIEDKSLDKQ